MRQWFPYIALLLCGTLFVLLPIRWFQGSSTLALAHSAMRELIHGNLNGEYGGLPSPVNPYLAEPGDILLCHNPHGAYGYWTHSVLYVGSEQVVDANDFARGTILQNLSHYRDYDEVLLLRPKVPVTVRLAAADAARKEVGLPYDPLGSLQDDHSSYCSKVIWQAYKAAGVELFPAHGWILPDAYAASSNLERIVDWHAESSESGR
ncbi:YiiX/YebB-like N1pC/P60 family cysteine hydrolase [Alicyclobacillus ferrooxydans]|uniref:YiiX/YebB-like N1pC/P60 family cysteine hydrolase n=1 Tax=Alicyclobacillus ferrooxydans TaxID=471514 RepID=UPI0006D56C3F|nr:YiiX/YebB-like N1pC/P60 family cysteine hydrolase [Alicyclobacillus ferrooxydans]